MNPSFFVELRRLVGAGAVLQDPLDLITYECDALPHLRSVPAAVVLPSSAAEVQGVVRLCAREKVPFVARGHGTGLSGGALPVSGCVLIAMSRLNRVLSVDIPNQRVTVEPGVTNLEITRQVAPFGYYYAPDPSSQQVCSIGGNVAENSGGAHCLKYGFTTHHVLGVEGRQRIEDLLLLVPQRLGRQAGRRLHGDEAEDLEEVGDHHVAEGPGALVEGSPPFEEQCLGDVDLHVLDVFPVPDRLEEAVGETEGQDVVDRLLPQEVVDAEDL